ncbi:MAG: RnfABCDGE type electron transport complex subunit B, partial [Gammaproteobacteria bacterium]|nr:RnfABCDGE type electron transport complex subunit B [Gammaproteobacteria bacterium]
DVLSIISEYSVGKPRQIAVIDEDVCIGCVKCVKVCPVDAIVGAPKQMHTVITQECIGCELCIEPCPVDCISMVPTESVRPHIPFKMSIAENEIAQQEQTHAADDHALQRFHARNKRLAREKQKTMEENTTDNIDQDADKRNYILAAVERTRAKREQLKKSDPDTDTQ